jgi:heme exporter protein D
VMAVSRLVALIVLVVTTVADHTGRVRDVRHELSSPAQTLRITQGATTGPEPISSTGALLSHRVS